ATRMERLAPLGIRPGAHFRDLSSEQQAAWRSLLPSLIAELRAGDIAVATVRAGWNYPRAGIGDFGDDDPYRARVALGGLAALPPEEAMYLGAREDTSGQPLDGGKRYRLRIPSGGVPVQGNGFWSLTMYEVMPDGRRFLVANPI